jgi:hypothetical protein
MTHGRSLKIQDLQDMRLKITDYSQQPELNDAISRYYALLQMAFATNIYKIYETPSSQIIKTIMPPPGLQQLAAGPQPGGMAPTGAGKAHFDFKCDECATINRMQANLGQPQPIDPGRLPFPKDNRFKCPKCGKIHDFAPLRKNFETQAKLPVV